MRRTTAIFALLFLVFILTLWPGSAHAQFGVAAGLNFERLSDIEAFNVKTTFDNANGYHVGVFYDLGLGVAGIRIGAFYRDLGEFDAGDSVQEDLQKVDMTMIDFPVDVRVNLTSTPAVSPYVLAGPVFSLPSSGNDVIDGTLESLFISGNVGFGVSLNLGGIRLLPEFRYAIGISRLVKDGAQIGGVDLVANNTKVNTAMLRLGVIF